ncbi:MAG: sulfur carrier protein ThiS [Alphaproteobacteria bacterium TMED93]|nr:MAG: sulfur carrier protein ThiS [Alphaproteobacteria bacterium TMED93]|tara:strand:+ start:670 stop:885 length:216 start_codon:yes stop_codon:yes gene_type:complete
MTEKTIQVFINGKKKSFSENNTLVSLLNILEIDGNGIAIEVNLVVIPKSQYKNIIIKNDDKIEIVQFIGGG